MNKKRIKRLIKNNLELKILALVVAIFVWLYVYHIEVHLPQFRNISTSQRIR